MTRSGLALALALAACTETERGHVEVVAYDKLGGGPAALRIISPAAAQGRITTPRLPRPLSKYQPDDDFLIHKRGFLFRVEGFDPALARRLAETSPYFPAVRFHPLATMPTWSVASTLIFGA